MLSSQDMLAKLVSFDTVSRNSNLNLIHWVQDYLSGFGIKSTLIFDATKTKANLHAVIGPEDKPGTVLSGHTDVVPVDGQNWESDPFQLKEHDGHLYARGTSDMKGFIAVALAKVPEMKRAHLKSPIHFSFSYDEEIGCLGAPDMVKHLQSLPVRPNLCIVGEPTGMRVISGHKGICSFHCTVRGKEAHSSLAPYAVNAVENAAELVTFIKTIARRHQSEGPFNKLFDPPFTTVHTGLLHGGTALNIVPNLAELSFEIRNIPEVDPMKIVEEIRDFAFRNIEPRMKDIEPETGFEFRPRSHARAFDIDNSHEAVALVQSLSGSNGAEKVSFATEAGFFHGGGIPTVVCGPGHIAQAHKPNEFIAMDQIVKCENMLDRLIARLTSP